MTNEYVKCSPLVWDHLSVYEQEIIDFGDGDGFVLAGKIEAVERVKEKLRRTCVEIAFDDGMILTFDVEHEDK